MNWLAYIERERERGMPVGPTTAKCLIVTPKLRAETDTSVASHGDRISTCPGDHVDVQDFTLKVQTISDIQPQDYGALL